MKPTLKAHQITLTNTPTRFSARHHLERVPSQLQTSQHANGFKQLSDYVLQKCRFIHDTRFIQLHGGHLIDWSLKLRRGDHHEALGIMYHD